MIQLLQKPERQVRELMGRWAKAGMGNALEVFDAAIRQNPADPVQWISAAITKRVTGGPAPFAAGVLQPAIVNPRLRGVRTNAQDLPDDGDLA